jgi:hypothetical protein
MVATRNPPATAKLNPRQEVFCRLVVGGKSQAEAWKEAYGHPEAKARGAIEAGSRLANDPRIAARMKEMTAAAAGKTILTVNDRLAILARDAQLPGNTAPMVNARARVVEVYTKLAGGAQPERSEVTVKGDPDAPVVVAVTVNKAPVRDRIAALRAAKERN